MIKHLPHGASNCFLCPLSHKCLHGGWGQNHILFGTRWITLMWLCRWPITAWLWFWRLVSRVSLNRRSASPAPTVCKPNNQPNGTSFMARSVRVCVCIHMCLSAFPIYTWSFQKKRFSFYKVDDGYIHPSAMDNQVQTVIKQSVHQ